jgi:hypothetical protein
MIYIMNIDGDLYPLYVITTGMLMNNIIYNQIFIIYFVIIFTSFIVIKFILK